MGPGEMTFREQVLLVSLYCIDMQSVARKRNGRVGGNVPYPKSLPDLGYLCEYLIIVFPKIYFSDFWIYFI